MTFLERKKKRKEHYFKYVHQWKLGPCSACNASGFYDNEGSPLCSSCNGTGKERIDPKDHVVKNGKYDEDYDIIWYKDGKFHKEDGPAIIPLFTNPEWFYEGQLIFKDGVDNTGKYDIPASLKKSIIKYKLNSMNEV